MPESVPLLMKDEHYSALQMGFQSVGYAVAADKFMASNYGSPQHRERVFGIAVNYHKLGKTVQQAHTFASDIVREVPA